jgi:hypothetical protein
MMKEPQLFYFIMTEKTLKEHVYTAISSLILHSHISKWLGPLECDDFS